MTIIKNNLDELLKNNEKIILDIGCGINKKTGSIGVDKLELDGVDIVADIEDGLGFMPDSSVDEIHARSFMEHINNFEFLMKDIFRVLKKNGKVYIFVPHFVNPYYYSDYTHKRFFGLYTFCYFTSPENNPYRRRIPSFYNTFKFKIISQRIIFKSGFRKTGYFKRIISGLFNLNTYMQELYEGNFCYIFPCYALEIILTPCK